MDFFGSGGGGGGSDKTQAASASATSGGLQFGDKNGGSSPLAIIGITLAGIIGLLVLVKLLK